MVEMAASGKRQSTITSGGGSGSRGEPNQTSMSLGGDLSHHSFQLTFHKLDGRNYFEWAQLIKLAIDGRGKLGYLIGEVKKPETCNPWMSRGFFQSYEEETRSKVMLKSELDMKPALENFVVATIWNEPKSDKKNKPWCDHYKKHWHTWDTCWKIHGKPLTWKKKNTTDNQAFQATREEQG
ncbi:hypothetical protein ACH5RR_006787 [Cinchona calisaya]|uniref:Retrotransposon Copia-like N-terminal domain-containing protein n=1 Tax=Cinchona calisaya TaxID=153742 RepID=A0ABD3APZ4_9GENT